MRDYTHLGMPNTVSMSESAIGIIFLTSALLVPTAPTPAPAPALAPAPAPAAALRAAAAGEPVLPPRATLRGLRVRDPGCGLLGAAELARLLQRGLLQRRPPVRGLVLLVRGLLAPAVRGLLAPDRGLRDVAVATAAAAELPTGLRVPLTTVGGFMRRTPDLARVSDVEGLPAANRSAGSGTAGGATADVDAGAAAVDEAGAAEAVEPTTTTVLAVPAGCCCCCCCCCSCCCFFFFSSCCCMYSCSWCCTDMADPRRFLLLPLLPRSMTSLSALQSDPRRLPLLAVLTVDPDLDFRPVRGSSMGKSLPRRLPWLGFAITTCFFMTVGGTAVSGATADPSLDTDPDAGRVPLVMAFSPVAGRWVACLLFDLPPDLPPPDLLLWRR